MPGAGKSTVGAMLARQTGREFVDTDDLIRSSTGCSLQYIVDNDGYQSLRKIEQDVITGLAHDNQVIATGGSAVYSAKAMSHLAAMATLVYLVVPFDVIEDRISDLDTRGLAKAPDQTLADLYAERVPLYEKYARIHVDANDTPEQVVANIVASLDP
jgi:shikimate kinase